MYVYSISETPGGGIRDYLRLRGMTQKVKLVVE
jgi:hypothetical protein